MSERRHIPLTEPHLGGNERAYLEECVSTNFVSSVGPFVTRFEKEFASFVGSRYAVPCSTGTAALHVALHVLGISPGDEVLVSDLTFIASANPILYESASAVLVDSEAETWNLDPALVIEELERRARLGLKQPRALIAVHVLGQPVDLDPMIDACDRHGVVVIEDAAEALGARYVTGRSSGRQVGTVGRMGCFSFNGNKVITTGGGGMLVTDDEALARHARHLTTQARLPGLEYRHDEIGFNYRLTNVAAALGLAQLEQLPFFLERKRAIAERYDRALGSVEGILLPPRTPWGAHSNWLYTIRLSKELFGERDEVMRRMIEHGVQVRPMWTPLHLMPMYADSPRLQGGVGEALFREGLSLPCSVQLTEADQDFAIETLIQSRHARA